MKFESTETTKLHQSGRTTLPKIFRDQFKGNVIYVHQDPDSNHSIITTDPTLEIDYTKGGSPEIPFLIKSTIHLDSRGSMRLPILFQSRLNKGDYIYFIGAGDHIKMLTETQYFELRNNEFPPPADRTTSLSSQDITNAVIGKKHQEHVTMKVGADALLEKSEVNEQFQLDELAPVNYPQITSKEEFTQLNIQGPADPKHRIHIIRQNRVNALEAAIAAKSELEIIISEMSKGHNGGPAIDDEGVQEFDVLKELKGMRDTINTAIKFLEDNINGNEWRAEKWKDINKAISHQLSSETKGYIKLIGRFCLKLSIKNIIKEVAKEDEG